MTGSGSPSVDLGAWLDGYVADREHAAALESSTALRQDLAQVQAELDAAKQQVADRNDLITALQQRIADLEAQLRPATAATVFGVSTNSQAALTAAKARGWSGYRIFYPGALPASWGADARLAALQAGDVVVVSAKDMSPGSVAAFPKGKPDGVICYLSWHHEPENDALDKAAYRSTWATLGPAIRAAGCIPMLILMGWTASPGSGRDYRDWYSAGAVDAIGWDAYNPGNKNTLYTDPSKITADLQRIAAETGLPWGITETGAKDFGVVDGQTRAQWAAAFAAELRKDGAVVALWWDQANAAGTFDVRLDDATATAWR